ncbi:pilus assembly PilX N-terminal domain-containing protein [Natroniella sp. ANB-PHB2]|uniref:pilus assembly PilX N-terminal domain-containing protein n=1 Tax=Natroniella sp. ANB-PHB2 TaxID=3384444 RepID=UPI0038D3FE08
MLIHQEEGSVLVLALLVMIILTVLVTGMSVLVNSEIRLTSSNEGSVKAFYLAEAGLEYGRSKLGDETAWKDRNGDEFVVPNNDDWFNNIVDSENEIKVKKYKNKDGEDDWIYKLESTGTYTNSSRTVEAKFVVEGFSYEEVEDAYDEDGNLENAHIFTEEYIDVHMSGGGDIKNTTIESTENEVDIKIAGGGGDNEIKNVLIKSKEGIETDLASGGNMECVVFESEGDVTIKPSNNTTMENVVIKSKGEVEIDLGQGAVMNNVIIYVVSADIDKVEIKERGGSTFEEGVDYIIKNYDDSSFSNELECDPGYDKSEEDRYIIDPWSER